MEIVIKIIEKFGFPAAVCIALAWFIWKLYQDSVKREEKLMEVNEKAIKTIAKYADRLDDIQTDVQIIKQDMIILLQEGEKK